MSATEGSSPDRAPTKQESLARVRALLTDRPERTDDDVAQEAGLPSSAVAEARKALRAEWSHPRDVPTRRRVARMKRAWVLRMLQSGSTMSNDALINTCKHVFGTGLSQSAIAEVRQDMAHAQRSAPPTPKAVAAAPASTPKPKATTATVEYTSAPAVTPRAPDDLIKLWWRVFLSRLPWETTEPSSESGRMIYRRRQQGPEEFVVERRLGVKDAAPDGTPRWMHVYTGPIVEERPEPNVAYMMVQRPATPVKVRSSGPWYGTAVEAVANPTVKPPLMLVRRTTAPDGTITFDSAMRKDVGTVLINHPEAVQWNQVSVVAPRPKPASPPPKAAPPAPASPPKAAAAPLPPARPPQAPPPKPNPNPKDTQMAGPDNGVTTTGAKAAPQPPAPAPAPKAVDTDQVLMRFVRILVDQDVEVSIRKNTSGNLCLVTDDVQIDFTPRK